MIHTYDKNLRNYARENRKNGNLSEALLWNKLKRKQLGYDFTKQKPIGSYIADFYCKSLNLVIEIDGCSHDGKIEYDRRRDEYMNNIGIKSIRVKNSDVLKNINFVIATIRQNFP